MPLWKTWEEDEGRWGIWQVTETPEELRDCLSDTKVQQELDRLKAPSRRLEYLAVRVLLKTLCGKEVRIGHEPSGKPFLWDDSRRISISHTRNYVAVGLHATASPGIDIEMYGDRVRKVASRFVREDEISGRDSMEPREELYQLLLHWSAKETMFKMLDCQEVDFLSHLKVEPFKLAASGVFRGESFRLGFPQHFMIHYLIHPEFVCTYCVGNDGEQMQADFVFKEKR